MRYLLIVQTDREEYQEILLCCHEHAFEAITTVGLQGTWWELVDLTYSQVIDSAENYHGRSG
jgi:hypothetical protein